ncbi:MAG: PACE efflux transporter [Burkholderiaceae bacterium]|nr:PACE efflux transporter [Burkholderiaceae bacterium]
MTHPAVAVRSARERALQTLWFEAIGIAVVAPLYALGAGSSVSSSALLLVALSLAVMAWSACFNTAFDLLERRWARRRASDRTQRWRIAHALLHEASAVLVTWPLIVALTDLGWLEALVADLALTLIYAAYAYLFHLGFDRLRPVR